MARGQDSEQRVSAAIGEAIRVNEILNVIADGGISLNANTWYYHLWQLRREIWPRMNQEERTAITNKLTTLKEQVAAHQNNNRQRSLTMPDNLFRALDQVDCDLRVLAFKYDLLISKKETFLDELGKQFQYS